MTSNNLDSDVYQAKTALENGGILLYPTDTLYGLGVDALNVLAIRKLKDLKGRDEGKPITVVVSDIEMAERYVEVTDTARALAERFLPGGLTIILRKKALVPDELTGGKDTLGIRIPDNEFCLELARAFGRPYTATSANVSGEMPARSVSGILEQFGEQHGIDGIVDVGELAASEPSTVIDLSGSEPKLLREGAVTATELDAFWRETHGSTGTKAEYLGKDR